MSHSPIPNNIKCRDAILTLMPPEMLQFVANHIKKDVIICYKSIYSRERLTITVPMFYIS